jgi:hypothetical protein
MDSDMRTLSIVAASAVFAAVALSGAADGSPAAGRCTLWAAPYGVDTNPGTQVAPFLTLAKLAGTLTPGQTGCLPAGTSFATREAITAVGTPAGRITITTAPGGARAVLSDGIETTQATRFLTLTNLAVGALNNSANGNVSGTVILRGYSTALTHSDVGPGALKEGGRSCIVLDHAGSALIDGNVLHECNGPSKVLYGAGVLASISTGARIVNNVIYGNVGGDAIAFSPNAQVSRARFNLIVDNLGGIYFGGDAKVASRDTLVEQNVITRNSRFDVHSAYGSNSPVGKGNIVRRNCIWSPGAVTAAGAGFRMAANRKVDPRVVEGQGTYRLAASSPCRAYRPRP